MLVIAQYSSYGKYIKGIYRQFFTHWCCMENNDFQPDEEPSGDGKTLKRQNFAPSNGGLGLHLLFEVVMKELRHPKQFNESRKKM